MLRATSTRLRSACLSKNLRVRAIHSSPPSRATESNRFRFRFAPDWRDPLYFRKWDTGTRVVGGLTLFAGTYIAVHLERVPDTGRLRFMDISEEYERKLSETSRAQLNDQFRDSLLPRSHPVSRHVSRVVARILQANNLGHIRNDLDFASSPTERKWSLFVVNDQKTINAMAEYGNIVVFTGLLPVCGDEASLAAVLGHEIGHSVARHSSERYSSIKILLGLALLLEALGIDFGLARLATNLLISLPNSRTQELEADLIGLRLMARACYDPRATTSIQDKLAKLESGSLRSRGGLSVGDFLRTHPRSERRSEILERSLPEAYALQEKAGCAISLVGADGRERRGGVNFGRFLNAGGRFGNAELNED